MNKFRIAILIFAILVLLSTCIIFVENKEFMETKVTENIVFEDIRNSLKATLPKGGKAILFGSQARGTAREDSDWDILVVLDKESLKPSDYDNITFPLTALGWEIGQNISPVMYTRKEWDSNCMTLFYKNVQRDGIVLL